MSRFLARILIQLIYAYQAALGPHLGGRCRFQPSCSDYGRKALLIHGPRRGLYLILRRIVKCGPWHSGGFDPVPDVKAQKIHASAA